MQIKHPSILFCLFFKINTSNSRLNYSLPIHINLAKALLLMNINPPVSTLPPSAVCSSIAYIKSDPSAGVFIEHSYRKWNVEIGNGKSDMEIGNTRCVISIRFYSNTRCPTLQTFSYYTSSRSYFGNVRVWGCLGIHTSNLNRIYNSHTQKNHPIQSDLPKERNRMVMA